MIKFPLSFKSGETRVQEQVIEEFWVRYDSSSILAEWVKSYVCFPTGCSEECITLCSSMFLCSWNILSIMLIFMNIILHEVNCLIILAKCLLKIFVHK